MSAKESGSNPKPDEQPKPAPAAKDSPEESPGEETPKSETPKPEETPKPAEKKTGMPEVETQDVDSPIQETPHTESAHQSPDKILVTSLKEQLEAAIAERDDLKNKWLRTEAELDNYRKRVQREMAEVYKYQVLPLTKELLPGMDNLGRAVAAAETSQNVEDVIKGVGMVAKQFDDILSKFGVVPIEAMGKAFDPNLHEALQQFPSADHPPMTILQEVERGYTLHDRVVRPSKVIISSLPPEPKPEPEPETESKPESESETESKPESEQEVEAEQESTASETPTPSEEPAKKPKSKSKPKPKS